LIAEFSDYQESAMREARENESSLENSAELTPARIVGLRTRTLAQAFAVAAVLALWAAPSTPAQDSSQSSAQSQNASQPAQSAAPNQPQMVDQSAPASESLAEAARKAKAAKAKNANGDAAQSSTTASPRVYSNENLGSLSSHGVSYVGGSGSSSSGSSSDGANNSGGVGSQAGNSAGAAAGGKNDESYWRGRAQEIRNQMADIDRQIERVQDDIAKNGAVTVDPSSGARQGVIMVEDRNAEIKHLQDKKADLQNSLDQLAEEGRKAGADSGWFR
jgi:hypothetical protein